MTYRETLQLWVREALAALGGEAKILDVSKRVWAEHENDLKQAGNAFYSWQYDLRWAANELRRSGHLSFRIESGKSVWVLKK